MPKEVEQQLRNAVIQSKLSSRELMKLSGVNHAIISRFLNGQRTITLPVASKLAKALGLELKPTKDEAG
jgi:plasmid maintenance system antidote protein VapI